MNKPDTRLSYLILMLFIIKVLWICAIIGYAYLNFTTNNYADKVLVIEELLHLMFALLVGIMLIYLFNHLTTHSVCVTGHTKMQLYTLGILTILGVIKSAIRRYVPHFLNVL